MLELLERAGPIECALDFGSGDGFFASQWGPDKIIKSVTPVDVVVRATSRVIPIIYDGKRLPFDDRHFDLVYAIDVLHHCLDPELAIEDLLRCSDRLLLIKDHTYEGGAGRAALALLDEIGNRKFGIPSPYLYQQRWAWVEKIESRGWRRLALHHPMKCHSGVLGVATNALQFIGLWERARSDN